MSAPDASSLFALVSPQHRAADSVIADASRRVLIRDLRDKTNLVGKEGLLGRSVLLATVDQLSAVLALVELDGIARRIVICPPDIVPAQLGYAFADASLDAVVTDGRRLPPDFSLSAPTFLCSALPETIRRLCDRPIRTEWLLFTSGTTGRPKLVRHNLETLTGAFADGVGAGTMTPVWSTFYDVRRYGGLQVLLRALAGPGSMILSDPVEPAGAFLRRAGEARVSHISGTPSHWRRALMSGDAGAMAPRYVRLSGEAADQAILDALQAAYPEAAVAHAFASTEAGVAFDVRDGKAGFPVALIRAGGAVSLEVEDGTLRIRSARTAAGYVGADAPGLLSEDGFVDTGDLVEQRGDRYVFVGRRNDIINVGGLKVHPERIEAVINQHPAVRMSRVSGRANPIMGAIVVADIVFGAGHSDAGQTKAEILELCQGRLARHEIPTSLRTVSSLPIAASGKLMRHHA